MRRSGLLLPVAAGILLAASSTSAWAAEPEPRMVGDIDAGPVFVADATTVGDDFVYLGGRGRERQGLHWFDSSREREPRLAGAREGDMHRELATIDDRVIFTGFTQRQATEPWLSDGTRAGTRLLKEIDPGRRPGLCAGPGDCPTYPAGSEPMSFLTIDGVTYFTAAEPRTGRELWRTDGTRNGTRLVKDVRPGKESGVDFGAVVEFDGQLYFFANDGRHGVELWRTDGTGKGTRRVTDIGSGWGTWPSTPVAVGDRLYFVGWSKDEGAELWSTDGTVSGTGLVMDIRDGPKTSDPRDLTAVGETLYFTAADRGHGRELWRSDGTEAGTTLVADLTPGKGSSRPGDLIALDDQLYFTVWDGPGELVIPGTLFRSDGTEAGTGPVDMGVGEAVGVRRFWTEYPSITTRDGRLYLAMDDGVHGSELWTTDGTAAGSRLVGDIRPGAEGSDPEWFTLSDSFLYMVADDGEHGRQIWAQPLTES
jgi:ELWxxDGT repeat protein